MTTRYRTFYRCPECQICPHPDRIEELWGETSWDLAQAHCLACRTYRMPTCNIAYFPKISWLPPSLWTRDYIPKILQVYLNLDKISYLTDGSRVWFWPDYPQAESLCKLDLPTFLGIRHRIRWIGQQPTRELTHPPEIGVPTYVKC